jgi:hypothetical protein
MSATGPEPFAATMQGQPEAKQPEREARKQARQEVKKRERRKKKLEEREHAERAQMLEALGIPTGDALASTDGTA